MDRFQLAIVVTGEESEIRIDKSVQGATAKDDWQEMDVLYRSG